jgi:hypothetical protein
MRPLGYETLGDTGTRRLGELRDQPRHPVDIGRYGYRPPAGRLPATSSGQQTDVDLLSRRLRLLELS